MSDAYDRLVASEMLDAAERIGRYLVGFSEEAFHQDLRTVDAVCMNLVRIGEGARELSDSAKAAAPHLPWRRMQDMRNRIAHSYAGLQLNIIWDVARVRVPDLEAFLRARFGPEA